MQKIQFVASACPAGSPGNEGFWSFAGVSRQEPFCVLLRLSSKSAPAVWHATDKGVRLLMPRFPAGQGLGGRLVGGRGGGEVGVIGSLVCNCPCALYTRIRASRDHQPGDCIAPFCMNFLQDQAGASAWIFVAILKKTVGAGFSTQRDSGAIWR